MPSTLLLVPSTLPSVSVLQVQILTLHHHVIIMGRLPCLSARRVKEGPRLGRGLGAIRLTVALGLAIVLVIHVGRGVRGFGGQPRGAIFGFLSASLARPPHALALQCFQGRVAEKGLMELPANRLLVRVQEAAHEVGVLHDTVVAECR